ncbi:BrnT family toxin [Methyloprofundus sp.]|uniref:BrnT family toxin n=1 Tax=Methyloprofundus sp. TaxID=2020875 RepID=UPI003D123218
MLAPKRRNYKETREISIGMLGEKLIIVVAHTDANDTTRIISARTANRKERGIYHEHIKTAH